MNRVLSSFLLVPVQPFSQLHPQHAKGRFIAIINEGDPVPLAQKEYILTFLGVYVKSRKVIEAKVGAGFSVPDQVLKLSGDCVLLRVLDPKSFDIGWYSVHANIVQTKLFGNPQEHFMIDYRARIYGVLGLEPPEETLEL
jgi:hypothetical protein